MLVMSAIERMDGMATPSKIAEEENMRSSNLASLLRDLEARELITRTQDTGDRRRTWLELSKKAGWCCRPAGINVINGWTAQ